MSGLVSALVMLGAALVYLGTVNTKRAGIAELARLLFMAAAIALMLQYAGHTKQLF